MVVRLRFFVGGGVVVRLRFFVGGGVVVRIRFFVQLSFVSVFYQSSVCAVRGALVYIQAHFDAYHKYTPDDF